MKLMDKKQVRVEIHNTIDKHCSVCTKTQGMDVGGGEVQRYCLNHCRVGKHINEMGKLLDMRREEMKVPAAVKIISTKEDYLQFKLQGMSNAEIAKKFGISDATLYNRMKVWGVKAEKKVNTPVPKHPPAFYDYLEEQGLKDKADEMRTAAEKQVDADGPHTPTQQEREEIFATHVQTEKELKPETDKALQELAAAARETFAVKEQPTCILLRIPIVKGDHVGAYGMQVHERYEQFGKHIDFAHLDRGAVFQETLQLIQAVMSWLQFDIGQLVVDEAERLSTLLKFIEHHSQSHIKEVLAKAAENGWEVIRNDADR